MLEILGNRKKKESMRHGEKGRVPVESKRGGRGKEREKGREREKETQKDTAR